MENDSVSQSPHFSGSIVHHFDAYLGPLFFEPYAIEVSNRIDPSSVRVALELACGTGRVTRHLRKVLPDARLIATDISPDMLAVAREKLNEENIEWKIIDAGSLPFQASTMDLVVCCFGYMFVEDKIKAFSEAYRVLKPGAMLLFTTWDKLERIATSFIYRQVVKKYLTDPLPKTYGLPFSLNDESEIREMLHLSGFSKVSVERSAKLSVSASAREATEGLTQGGPIYNEIMSRNPAWMDEIKASVEKQLAEKYGDAPMIAPMSALIVQAWK